MERMLVLNRKMEEVPFDKKRIESAIKKAMISIGEDRYHIAEEVAEEIRQQTKELGGVISITTIEKLVFDKLVQKNCNATARSYEAYRSVRAYQREETSVDQKILSLIGRTNQEVLTENSNKDAILNSTQRDLIAGEISKDLSMRKLLPGHIVQAHKDAAIHVHDLDYYIQPETNCCLINLGDMLQNGTVINKKGISKPRSFQVACTVATQIVAQISSGQYGGQSIDIKHLVPFIDVSRKKIREQLKDVISSPTELEKAVDVLLRKEVKSGVQTITYQLNTLNSVNGQAPFVTVFMNLKQGENEADMEMLVREILEQRMEGIDNQVGVKVTPSFPKLIYVLNEDTVRGGKYYAVTELAAKCTAKRLYPDYISEKVMKEVYEGNVFSSMGCRSFLNPWKNEKGEYQFEGRLNFGVCTVNLPQVAILADGDLDRFYAILDERLKLVKEVGLIRYNHLKDAPAKLSPIHWMHGGIARLGAEEKIGKLLKGGRSTVSVGYIGLHETVLSLTGESITSEKGHQLGLDILKYITEQIKKWREETDLYFSLYGTPSESTAGRLCEIDAKNFGHINGITSKGYYTNSYHVTPSEEIDAFRKLKLESDFQRISTGGCISYIEIPNMTKNIDAILSVLEFMYENMLYSEFNTKSDYCHVCGFDGEILINEDLEWECPQCHNKDVAQMNVIRRTCGYLGENFWSKGRTKDIKDRVLHL